MKHPKLIPIALSFCTFVFGSLYAQQTPDQSDEEIVRLSPFSVEERADIGRYQAVESTSGSRIRMDLMDSTQSISVVTNEFMQDIGTSRMLDAAKYVAGIGEGGDPNAMDTNMVRGFLNQGATIDGVTRFNWANQDPIVIERIEVVKGPNAILAPQGLPGGVINYISKRPLFKNQAYLSYQVGRYDANRAELDVNYVVRSDKLAVRVVGAFSDSNDFGKGAFHQITTVSPMFTYRISPRTDFTLQLSAHNSSVLTNVGVPLSPYAVGRSNIRLLEGLPRDFETAGRNTTRSQSGQDIRFFLTSQVTDKLSMRLVGNWAEVSAHNTYIGTSTSEALDANGDPVEVITLDPLTGEWGWDGVTRNDNPRYTLGGGDSWPKNNNGSWQHDFAYHHSGASWKSQTVVGYAINYNSNEWNNKNYEPIPGLHDFRNNYTPPASYTAKAEWDLAHSSSWTRSHQIYLYQVVHLFEDRLVLSGSLTRFRYGISSRNNLNPNAVPPPRPADWPSPKRPESLLPSVGVVYKIVPSVSLYYGFTKQELPGFESVTDGIPPHSVPSTQHEGGVRVRLFDGKLYATVAYFDILQENLYTGDIRNFLTPQPNPPYPAVVANRTAKGLEFEFTWALTPSLSIVGNYTDFKNRDKDNMPYTNVAEKSAAIWGSYTFSETGPLRGLSVGIGVHYAGERPGFTNGQYTTPPPGYDPVRIQPMFWLPSYTLVEASASYRFNKHWRAQLIVKNLLDKDYFPGSFLRMVHVGPPITPKLTLRYDF